MNDPFAPRIARRAELVRGTPLRPRGNRKARAAAWLALLLAGKALLWLALRSSPASLESARAEFAAAADEQSPRFARAPRGPATDWVRAPRDLALAGADAAQGADAVPAPAEESAERAPAAPTFPLPNPAGLRDGLGAGAGVGGRPAGAFAGVRGGQPVSATGGGVASISALAEPRRAPLAGSETSSPRPAPTAGGSGVRAGGSGLGEGPAAEGRGSEARPAAAGSREADDRASADAPGGGSRGAHAAGHPGAAGALGEDLEEGDIGGAAELEAACWKSACRGKEDVEPDAELPDRVPGREVTPYDELMRKARHYAHKAKLNKRRAIVLFSIPTGASQVAAILYYQRYKEFRRRARRYARMVAAMRQAEQGSRTGTEIDHIIDGAPAPGQFEMPKNSVSSDVRDMKDAGYELE